MEEISYNEFYSLMGIAGVIIVEDQMKFDNSRKAILLDYLMMEDVDRKDFISNIEEKTFKDKLSNIYNAYLEYRDLFEWDKVPARDIEYYVKKRTFNDLYSAIVSITDKEIEENETVFQRFGLGIEQEKALGYKGILDGLKTAGNSLPLRIYTDFSAPDLKFICEDIKRFTHHNRFFLCIIDNFMQGEARGKEILDELEKIENAQKNGICITLSSQADNIARKTDEMYVGFVNKSAENIDKEIKIHLIKSQYKIMLNLFKEKRRQVFQKTFDYVAENMEVAVYLSAMAKEEGITNHEILNQWIDLREKFYTYQDCKKELKRMVLLSSLLERLEKGEVTKEIEPKDVIEFQRFEQYDYSVNEFMIPPMSGDVFYIKGNYYLLVGQECDLSIRDNQRKNSIAELIPIKLVKNVDLGCNKENYNYEKLLLGKFETIDNKTCNISIDCTRRVIIDNEILDLCTFNEQGHAWFNINQEMDIRAKYMLPIQWQKYYDNLKEHFNKLQTKYDTINLYQQLLGFGVEELVCDMGASHNNRIVSIIDFAVDDNIIKYDVRRVCRIRQHVLLVNKMYLEYRGRQAFNTINMDMSIAIQYTLVLENSGYKIEGKQAIAMLTTSRRKNDNVKGLDWIISKNDLIQFIRSEDADAEKGNKYEKLLGDLDERLVLEGLNGILGKNAIKYSKKEKDNEKLLIIKLLR